MKKFTCPHCQHKVSVKLRRIDFITSDEDAEPRIVHWAVTDEGGDIGEGGALYVDLEKAKSDPNRYSRDLQSAWANGDRDGAQIAAMHLALVRYFEVKPPALIDVDGHAILLTEKQLAKLIKAANSYLSQL